MNWHAKVLAQQIFSRVPMGERLNLLMQTRVTHSLPAPDARFEEIFTSATLHLEAVQTALAVDSPAGLHGYEFGAGWHLGVAVALAGLGVPRQTVVDRTALAHDEFIWHTLTVLQKMNPGLERLNDASSATDVDEALARLGIRYLAPVDARATTLDADSVDFTTSTSTLEHIPDAELDDLLKECHRVLRPGGTMSAMIDLGDHYAAADPSLTRLNFLKYSPSRWRLYSPSMQYQNRLRHSDYLARIERAGFEVRSVTAIPVPVTDSEWIDHSTVDRSFARYALDDLVIGDSHIVAVKV